jgi:hypothetical protein
LRKAAANAVGCAPQGALPPRAKPLTCPDRNISIPSEKDGLRQQPTSYQRKLRDSFQENVESFVTHYGREYCYSLLLTAKPTTPKGFSKCVNSAKTNLLRKLFVDEIDVIEATQKGSPHIHALVALPFACPDFPHDTLKRCRQAFRQGRHAHSQSLWQAFLRMIPVELRDLWLLLQAKLPRYGLGKMIELVPLRETGRALACYYGKYLAKGFADRPADWKHVRLVRYPGARARVRGGPKLDPKWKIATALRSSAGPRGWLWRQRLAKLASVFGITEGHGGISAILGTRWGYHHRETISHICLTEYPTGIHAQADGHDFRDHPDAPAPGDMIDVQVTDSNGVRHGYFSPVQTAWQCAEKAARWNPGARRFVERFFRSIRPIGYTPKPEMEYPF